MRRAARTPFQVRAAFASIVLTACAAKPPPSRHPVPSDTCTMAADEAAWVQRSLAAWSLVQRDALHAAPVDGPTVVLFDPRCVFRAEAGHPFSGAPHRGKVELPDHNSLPPQIASFAAPYDGGRAFFVMALPTIWRDGGVTSELGLENLMTAVLIHELTHTRQFYAFDPRIEALSARWGLGDDLNDDVVQDRFSAANEAPGFVADIDAERALLFAAAAAPTDPEARTLAGQALARIRARGARYFVGADAKFVDLEDVFLTMEGVAQWAGYSWLVNPRGGGFAPDTTLPLFRRGGRQWSQDLGLSIFLVVDRLVPDWQDRAFSAQPATAMELLALAAQ